MEKTNFISGLNYKDSDFEKIFYHVFNKSINEFVSKSKKINKLIIIFSIILVGGIILFFTIGLQIASVLLAIIGFGGLIYNFFKYSKLKIDSKLDKIGVVSIPFYHGNLQNKSALVDLSDLYDKRSFTFPNLSTDNNILINKENESIDELLENYPIVISPDKEKEIVRSNDLLKKENLKIYTEEIDLLERTEKINILINTAEDYSVSIPIIKKNEEFLNYLIKNDVKNAFKKLDVIKNYEIIKELNKVEGIVDKYVDNKSNTDIDELAVNLIDKYEKILAGYNYTLNSSDIVMSNMQLTANYQLYTISNNYYCPTCNAKSLQKLNSGKYYHNGNNEENKIILKSNTKLKLEDIEESIWKCPLCENETSEPIIKNKLDDELFTPVYDKLYEEHFKERLDIYNNINDQKRKYAEKASSAFHQVLRESRSKVDTIKSKLRNIGAEINMEQNAVKQLNELLIRYKKIKQSRVNEINREISRIKEKIEIENENSKRELMNAEKHATNNIDEATEKYANLEREDQKQRDNVQKQIADDTKLNTAISVAYAKKSGFNKKSGIFGLGNSTIEKELKNLKN